MSSFITKAVCIAAIVSSPLIASSQHYYVMVGAFEADENTGEFKNLSTEAGDSSIGKPDQSNLLHFYVLKASDKKSAIEKTLKLREEIENWNASEGNPANVGVGEPQEGVAIARGAKTKRATSGAVSTPAGGAVSDVSASAANMPPPPVGKYFKFEVESPAGGPVPAKVHHVDFDEGLEIASYKTNTFVDLLRPGKSNEPMAVVCGVFGYKEIEKYIDYRNPASTDRQAFLDDQGVWVIPYKLERLEEGDVSVMYNVSFYKDAVVMRSDSKKDLDELVNMMESNPYYEITVHAYCNGRNKRDIIALGSDKNYFDVAGAVTKHSSARELTALRAEAVRAYLAEHGIDPSRVKIFPWGGHDMLVKSDSPYAYLNDRIEIEILKD